jgi:hypothetical protein
MDGSISTSVHARSLRILEQCFDLFEAPARWCQHAEARDAGGANCHAVEARAVAWSALGALRRLEGRDIEAGSRATAQVIGLLSPAYNKNILHWNDTKGRTSSEVRALFAEAARLERFSP